jgi:uncharacterized protein (UPF0335 family)
VHNDLKQLAEQIVSAQSRIDDEKAHIGDLYAQAKSKGYDVKALRKAIRISEDVEKAKEELEVVNLYLSNMGQGELF